MIVTQITNHVEAALNRLLQQYKGKEKIVAVLTALIDQVQDLEDAIYPIDQYRQLAFAYGQQLDNLGQIVGLSRNGLPDDEYFVLLLGEIAENNSDTTSSTMLNIVQTVFQASQVFIKTPNSPGPQTDGLLRTAAQVAFGVSDPQTPASLDGVVQQIIQASLGSGIALIYLSSFDNQNAFSTAGSQSWCTGCSDLNDPQSTDGKAASLIYSNSKA